MVDHLKRLNKIMDEQTSESPVFTEINEKQILAKIKEQKKKTSRPPAKTQNYPRSLTCGIVCRSVVVYLLFL
jgi:hypothetical protein